jgi:hypothetical protein
MIIVMKTKLAFLLLPVIALSTMQCAPKAFAQPPGGRQFAGGGAGAMRMRARWNALSEDERARLKAAHRNALSDPSVRAAQERLKQARKEFREAMRPALLKADPSVQPILDKMKTDKAKAQ